MDKRGIGSPSLITIFVLIMVVMVLALAQRGIDTKTINSTIQTLNWTTIGGNLTNSIQNVADNNPNRIVKVIFGIINKGIDFFGYGIFEVTKLAMELARDNPNINWKVLFWLIILSLAAPILYYLFLAMIVIFLLLREWVLNRRDRKRLKMLMERMK